MGPLQPGDHGSDISTMSLSIKHEQYFLGKEGWKILQKVQSKAKLMEGMMTNQSDRNSE
jgi:hypothetical protein